MPNRNQIIVISVLGIAALMLGCKPNAKIEQEVTRDPVEPKPQPVKELTLREKLVGTYEQKAGGITRRMVLLDNGIMEYYFSGMKEDIDYNWSIENNEIHLDHILVWPVIIYKLNPDKSITQIAYIRDGKREDHPKELQNTFIKIN